MIFISVGYGFDERGRMSLKLRTLNQEGGGEEAERPHTWPVRSVWSSQTSGLGPQNRAGTPFGVRALRRFLR